MTTFHSHTRHTSNILYYLAEKVLVPPFSDAPYILGNSSKTLISATAGIGRLYKLQGFFIILLGVYCEIFFWWNPVEHLFFEVERFQY